MKKPNLKTCTEEELWKYVAHHLAKNGISSILVGGAVVAIYTKGLYKSGDLDFVLETFFTNRIPEIMAEIGFYKNEIRHYVHPECPHLLVEFASPPVMIGEDGRIVPNIHTVEGQKIKIYSPTDCIKDRLASYIHFKANDCLTQAVWVAIACEFDLNKVKIWCENEGAKKEYQEFLNLLKSEKKTTSSS